MPYVTLDTLDALPLECTDFMDDWNGWAVPVFTPAQRDAAEAALGEALDGLEEEVDGVLLLAADGFTWQRVDTRAAEALEVGQRVRGFLSGVAPTWGAEWTVTGVSASRFGGVTVWGRTDAGDQGFRACREGEPLALGAE